MNKFLLFISFQFIAFFVNAQCQDNLLSNGSFTGIKGEAVTAPGWTNSFGSPDLNDANDTLMCTPCFSWTGVPLSSADGGTWQNLFANESVSQTLSVVPGEIYSLCFQYAAQGIQCTTYVYTGPVGVQVLINGSVYFSTPDDATPFTWETACVNFTGPLSGQVILAFKPTKGQYVAIDDACLQNSIPDFIDDAGSSAVSIFPNPAKDEINIQTKNANETSLFVLYDYSGRELFQQALFGNAAINISHLSKGLYMYHILRENAIADKGIIVKE